MSAENRKLLADALRSGEYTQGKGALNIKEVGLCCLGVGCEVYQKVKGDLVITETGNKKGYDGQFGYAPRKVQEFFNMTYDGKLGTPTPVSTLKPGLDPLDDWRVCSLVSCNDSAGLTFEQIAGIIESGNLQDMGIVDNTPRAGSYYPPVETPVEMEVEIAVETSVETPVEATV